VLEIAQGREQSTKVSCGWSLEYWAQNFDMVWIWKVLGPVITIEAEQVYVTKPVFSSDGGGLDALFHALVFVRCQAL
jgi:hypothetical protein